MMAKPTFGKKINSSPVSKHSQSGAVLIVSLVLLLVMTLIGVSNMRSTSLQLNMAANSQARNEAFHAAEFALTDIEAEIQNMDFSAKENVWECTAGSGGGVSSPYCYNKDCTDGACFEGSYPSGALSKIECDMENLSSGSIPEVLWIREFSSGQRIWDTNGAYRVYSSTELDPIKPKYIVEFLCYVSTDPGYEDCSSAAPNFCAAFFRITVLAESETGNGKVMLQATTKKAP